MKLKTILAVSALTTLVSSVALADPNNGVLTLDNSGTRVNIAVKCAIIGAPIMAGAKMVSPYGGRGSVEAPSVFEALGLQSSGVCQFTNKDTQAIIGGANLALSGQSGSAPFYNYSTLSITNIQIVAGSSVAIKEGTGDKTGNEITLTFIPSSHR
jgi:hypothetical protein